MEQLDNKETCPYCSQLMDRDLYSDHLMCHQLENEELNSDNNLNPLRNNNNSNLSQNRNHNENNQNNSNNYNNRNNNQDNNLFPNLFGLFSSSNPENNNNSNNGGFLNSIIGGISNLNNESQINNNRNNSNNNRNNNMEEGNFLQNLSQGISNVSNTINDLKELGNQINNFGSTLFNIFPSNDSLRNNFSNDDSLRLERRFENNEQRNRINVNPVPRRGIPINVHRNERFRPIFREAPPIIVHGHRLNRNNNHISENEINRIMQYLPSSVLNERKEGDNNTCIICLGEFNVGDSVTTLPCVHIFHTECIKSWLQSKNNCPVCQYEITINSIMREN